MKNLFFNVLWATGAFAAGSTLLYIGVAMVKELLKTLFGR